MSTGIKNIAGSVQSGKQSVSNASGKKSKRNRKQYDYEMSDADRFALQNVQRAQSALRAINDAIKSGNKVHPDVVKLCVQINLASADVLLR